MSCFSPVSMVVPNAPEPIDLSLFKRSSPLKIHDKLIGYAKVEQAMVGQIKVGRVRSTGHDVSVVVEDQITVLVPFRGTVTCEIQHSTFRASTNEALILAPNPRQTRVLGSQAGDFGAIPLLFPMADVRQITEELSGSVRTRKKLENFGLSLSLGNSFQGRQFLQLIQMLV
ncbi:MAG: hypothetical protein ACU0CA_11575 [Paracoccaceae bacterium]